MQGEVGIALIPCYTLHVDGTTILQGVRLCTATSGIFPLCLGRKTELLASELAELLDKLLAILPTDIDHWQIFSLLDGRRIAAHDSFPKFLCHLGLADIVVLCDGHLVHRLLLIRRDVLHLACCADIEFTGIDENKVVIHAL